MEWQPIETAPKDGTYILVYRKQWPPAVVKWRKAVEGVRGDTDYWELPDTGSQLLGDIIHWAEIPKEFPLPFFYDEATDSLSITLSSEASTESEEVEENIILDYSATGKVVGIDIQHAKGK